MLLNPKAVERLKSVTDFYSYDGYPYPYRTHDQRNELSRMFKEEAERLLDHKAEQVIKHNVELYCKGDISYEQYSELIEQASREEESRGATQGGAYARNHVFDFAQKALEREKGQIHVLALTEAKKNLEVERQKADQAVKAAIQQGLAEIATAIQQSEEEKGKHVQALQEVVKQKGAELNSITSTHEEHLQHLVEQTKTEVDQAIATRWQEETRRREQEIYEQEALRPAREAARAATNHVTLQEQKVRMQKRRRNWLIGLGVLLLLALIIILLLQPFPQWISALLLVIVTSIFLTAWIWKSPIPEQTLLHNRKEVELFQTHSGDYVSLGEEERCTLLVQRIV